MTTRIANQFAVRAQRASTRLLRFTAIETPGPAPCTLQKRFLKIASCMNSMSVKYDQICAASLGNIRPISTSAVIRRKIEDDENAIYTNPFNKDFGNYEKVLPAEVTKVKREIPEHIRRPDYWKTGHPRMRFGSRNIEIKSADDISKMKVACSLARKVLNAAIKEVKVGMTTEQLDDFIFNYTIAQNAYPSPLNYKGFPKSVCTSVNNVACHGIPDNRPLIDGDIINIDCMVYIDGFHGDCSDTVLVGNVDEKGRKLVQAAKMCLDRGVMVCGPGVPFQRIGQVIQDVAEEQGFTVVPCFTGHGIGHEIHIAPDIYHYQALVLHQKLDNEFTDFPYPGRMQPGMTFTVEPVLSQGMEEVVILEDGWTAVTLDSARTAQFEHTILITEDGAEILTVEDK